MVYLRRSFSRRAILEQEDLVQEKVRVLCNGFDQYRENGSIFRVTDAFAAFAGDVISQYSFGFSYGQTERYDNGWIENFHDAYISLSAFGHVAVQFPWVNPVGKCLSSISVDNQLTTSQRSLTAFQTRSP